MAWFEWGVDLVTAEEEEEEPEWSFALTRALQRGVGRVVGPMREERDNGSIDGMALDKGGNVDDQSEEASNAPDVVAAEEEPEASVGENKQGGKSNAAASEKEWVLSVVVGMCKSGEEGGESKIERQSLLKEFM